jgi:1-deoxy-D-xylulose-5-phosphate reductoisomerase
MKSCRNIVILGSTGSIGVSTLDVVARHPEHFNVLALTAHRQLDRLYDQIMTFSPRFAVVADEAGANRLSQRLQAVNATTLVLHGAESLEMVAADPDADLVMAAIVGIAGLRPTLAAVNTGKRVLLANKEALVTAGPVFMEAVRRHGATLIPIDSEHNAIFQVFDHDQPDRVAKVILTCSGGPFRTASIEAMGQALSLIHI